VVQDHRRADRQQHARIPERRFGKLGAQLDNVRVELSFERLKLLIALAQLIEQLRDGLVGEVHPDLAAIAKCGHEHSPLHYVFGKPDHRLQQPRRRQRPLDWLRQPRGCFVLDETATAQKASGGRLDTPEYRRVMGEFLRGSGFIFLNKDDRARASQDEDKIEDGWETSATASGRDRKVPGVPIEREETM
jgi:hypothetical protein